MAITWKNHDGTTRTEHVGRVLDVFNRDYRAMSDVYTLATFATVVNDDMTTRDILVNANFECDLSEGRAEVDVSEDIKLILWMKRTLADTIRREEERLQNEKAAQDAAEYERNRPIKGKRMIIVSGRKAPKGTVGTVFWVRDGRVGMEPDGATRDARGYCTNAIWVDARHLKAV